MHLDIMPQGGASKCPGHYDAYNKLDLMSPYTSDPKSNDIMSKKVPRHNVQGHKVRDFMAPF